MIRSAAKILLIFLGSLIFSCAVKERPPGGPEDKTPPSILSVEPEPGSALIPLDTKFVITFSKTMNQTKTENAVFLSPVFWQYPTMKWSGKKLIVIPPEDLDSNQTYVLTVGADAEGYRPNKIGKSFSFAFSTGPKIDSCSISGVIYLPEGAKFYDIWAYPVEDTPNFSFVREIPDFATQIDSAGKFSIEYMNPGNYLVVAVDDRNDDLFWEPGSEPIGLPPFILPLSDGESFGGLALRPDRRDTLAASISRARVVDNRRIDVEFTQPVSGEKYLKPEFYKATSLDDAASLEIEGAYLGEKGQFVLETSPQIDRVEYRLYASGIISDWGVSFDTAGAGFEGTALADTARPRIISTYPGNRSSNVYQDSVVELTFTERIRVHGFPEAVSVIADSVDTLMFTPDWIAPNKARLVFPGRLPRLIKIEVFIDPGRILDLVGNTAPDSMFSFSFRLPPADTIGIVTARTEPGHRIVGLLAPLRTDAFSYISKSDKNGLISFETVLPGSYRFEYFEDLDDDGRWSSGAVDPFKPCERFSFLPDSVSVRSRWTTDLGRVDLPRIGR